MQRLKKHSCSLLLFSMLIMIILGSCSDKPSDFVLSEGKMEDVLFDYHIADGICQTSGYDSLQKAKCINAVFEKYGINREIFDSSMVYYMRHADKLEGIYKSLGSRMENEGRLQGIDGSNTENMSTDATADTANIWNLEKVKVFTMEVPYNTMRFAFKADSTFKAGDRFTLSFNADFIYQDGIRNGYCIFTMKLANDSVVTQTTSITSSNKRIIELNDKERVGVKELKGYCMHRPSNVTTDRNSSTLKMMILSDISLVKMHTPEPEPLKLDSTSNNNNEKTDSLGPRTEPNMPQRHIMH